MTIGKECRSSYDFPNPLRYRYNRKREPRRRYTNNSRRLPYEKMHRTRCIQNHVLCCRFARLSCPISRRGVGASVVYHRGIVVELFGCHVLYRRYGRPVFNLLADIGNRSVSIGHRSTIGVVIRDRISSIKPISGSASPRDTTEYHCHFAQR